MITPRAGACRNDLRQRRVPDLRREADIPRITKGMGMTPTGVVMIEDKDMGSIRGARTTSLMTTTTAMEQAATKAKGHIGKT
jgi:hypothetical protein